MKPLTDAWGIIIPLSVRRIPMSFIPIKSDIMKLILVSGSEG